MDQNKMSNIYRGPSIDASYQAGSSLRGCRDRMVVGFATTYAISAKLVCSNPTDVEVLDVKFF
jgi:hypothetical protein